MRFQLLALMMAASCLPALAEPTAPAHLVAQGNATTIRGRAHIERTSQGTYIAVENPYYTRNLAGFVPFGDDGAFPGLYDLEGRNVEISGVLVLDGRAYITMLDPDQLRVMG
ncbi:MAG TPA: hypothetical protein VN175_12020 [Rhizomicrobium sp.]|nr:hypothetical protein [Rhizomicrobium sp.]